jgi:hypothetical protein
MHAIRFGAGYHPFDPEGNADEEQLQSNIRRCRYDFNDPVGARYTTYAKPVVGCIEMCSYAKCLLYVQICLQAWEDISWLAKDLISHLLLLNPADRLDTGGVLRHPWIQQHTHVPNPHAQATGLSEIFIANAQPSTTLNPAPAAADADTGAGINVPNRARNRSDSFGKNDVPKLPLRNSTNAFHPLPMHLPVATDIRVAASNLMAPSDAHLNASPAEMSSGITPTNITPIPSEVVMSTPELRAAFPTHLNDVDASNFDELADSLRAGTAISAAVTALRHTSFRQAAATNAANGGVSPRMTEPNGSMAVGAIVSSSGKPTPTADSPAVAAPATSLGMLKTASGKDWRQLGLSESVLQVLQQETAKVHAHSANTTASRSDPNVSPRVDMPQSSGETLDTTIQSPLHSARSDGEGYQTGAGGVKQYRDAIEKKKSNPYLSATNLGVDLDASSSQRLAVKSRIVQQSDSSHSLATSQTSNEMVTQRETLDNFSGALTTTAQTKASKGHSKNKLSGKSATRNKYKAPEQQPSSSDLPNADHRHSGKAQHRLAHADQARVASLSPTSATSGRPSGSMENLVGPSVTIPATSTQLGPDSVHSASATVAFRKFEGDEPEDTGHFSDAHINVDTGQTSDRHVDRETSGSVASYDAVVGVGSSTHSHTYANHGVSIATPTSALTR